MYNSNNNIFNTKINRFNFSAMYSCSMYCHHSYNYSFGLKHNNIYNEIKIDQLKPTENKYS